ncbi:primosomal protein N' [Aciduricibacillus chroicocephali]|uniref:Replication restart protein PriA n=1 Tax=Aciduricibacillus chroicocephali TaxID=3054939 RepID=A0ABY9KYK3_9BACI|nr:primosomal protein N' [Bacillaceae bacterium 44XB]
MKIANVIVDVPSSSINQTFDYLVPERFEEVIEPGMRVLVPFGPRKIMGFVAGISENSEHEKLRSIIECLDIIPALTKELLEVGKWLAEETLCLYITAFQAMLPQALKSKYKKEYIRVSDHLETELERQFAGRDILTEEDLGEAQGDLAALQRAIRRGDVEINYIVKSRITKKQVTMVERVAELYKLEEAVADLTKQAVKQKEMLEYFLENDVPVVQSDLLKKLDTTSGTVKTLVDKGLLRRFKKEVLRNPYDDEAFARTVPHELNDQQKKAIEPINSAVDQNLHDIILLHGITGSGKTEVYLQAIEKVLAKGEEAIVLVPEISLTPQMVNRFKGRFGHRVAVMHSALSAGEKYDEWRKIQRKDVQVVVGARSAVFAPFENLGIIIMDEEHETTYKQEDQPRYHARDVAIHRANNHSCPVVLGSATPTLESYARAKKGVYKLAELTERTNGKPLPDVEIVDMREELHAGNRTMFSRKLKEKMDERISKGEQIVLLLNRRGYSTFVMCRDCGHVKECPHCDIALTYHKNSHQLKCHYCSYEEPMPLVCPECDSDAIRYFGTGTQRVEEALTQLMPEARIIRMDVDTTRKKGAHERLLNQFAEGGADILLGTQMIAKGLDFENVTLVGVLTADSMLHLPDFRSSERTFQLLTQVSGRAGRHELPGEVIVQTYTPDHYSVELASVYDFHGFFNREMRMRKTFHYPPYVFLALMTVSHENKIVAMQTARQIVQSLSGAGEGELIVLGPTPSPVPRVKDRYRFQCMVKYKNRSIARGLIEKAIREHDEKVKKDNLQIKIDLDPYNMM